MKIIVKHSSKPQPNNPEYSQRRLHSHSVQCGCQSRPLAPPPLNHSGATRSEAELHPLVLHEIPERTGVLLPELSMADLASA